MKYKDGIRRTMMAATLLVAAIAALSGCVCMEPQAPAAPKPQPVTRGTCPEVTVSGGSVMTTQLFPTGNSKSSVIMIESKSSQEVMVNQEFDYTIDVTNLTDCQLCEVVVTEEFDSGLTLKASSPQARYNNNRAVWTLDGMAPHETKTIKARLAASAAGAYEHCIVVDYEPCMCQTVVVIAPELQLQKSMPDSVLLCDNIPVTLKVSNTGTGTVRNVMVTDNLPSGLTALDGRQKVTFNVPSLTADQTETLSFTAKASRTGDYTNTATAESEGGLSADATATTSVHQPVLAISKTATERQFVGRNISYDITVKNTGDATADNLMVTDPLPQGTEFVSASNGGRLSGGKVVWNVGSLAAGKQASMSATVKGTMKGTVRNTASASAVCADAVSDAASTTVVGIPAILLEVIDIEDPIEVGNVETYVITVTNQGSEVDKDIAITCTLPPHQSYVSSSGVTTGTAAGQKVTFAPLAELEPGERAVWRVRAKAEKAGTIRFTVEMTSDFLEPPPVMETEATNQY
ncbi:MAG: DUF11 domain-containing protein [Candidatus Pacebacteria bacterium]|nr:DUF11 domain-containing protein [Candidatus Paceibacterota bacterium]